MITVKYSKFERRSHKCFTENNINWQNQFQTLIIYLIYYLSSNQRIASITGQTISSYEMTFLR